MDQDAITAKRDPSSGSTGAATSQDDIAACFDALDELWLRDMLERAHQPNYGSIAAGLVLGERLFAASVDPDGRGSCGESAGRRRPVGCVAKLFTGTLAMCAATEGSVDFESEITELIPGQPRELTELLRGVSLRQLLNHTSGIDCSDLESLPCTSAGRIDLLPLSSACAERRLFEPGRLYSYGSAGAWLAAAALEHVHAARYADLLTRTILHPAQIELSGCQRASGSWCPANGADLELSVPELLRFFRWFLLQNQLREHAELGFAAQPPGWCLERGSSCGWKFFGEGWYGHNMAVPGGSLLVRIHMKNRIALVVASKEVPASLITLRLFGRLLPEYTALRIPRPVPAAVTAERAAHIVGTYENRALELRITYDLRAGLRADAVLKHDRAAGVVSATLGPGTDGAWLFESPSASYLQWVQFVAGCSAAPAAHLWDGRQILRRSPPLAA